MSREIDAMVAETVMGAIPGPKIGITNRETWRFQDQSIRAKNSWSPSEDIAAAWEVVEKMLDGGHGFFKVDFSDETCEWNASFAPFKSHGSAETAPMAICLAALKALPIPQEQKKSEAK